MNDNINVISKNKIPIITAIMSFIISFFIIDFSKIKEFSILLFAVLILIYSLIFIFLYVAFTSFINGIKNDLSEQIKLNNGDLK